MDFSEGDLVINIVPLRESVGLGFVDIPVKTYGRVLEVVRHFDGRPKSCHVRFRLEYEEVDVWVDADKLMLA